MRGHLIKPCGVSEMCSVHVHLEMGDSSPAARTLHVATPDVEYSPTGLGSPVGCGTCPLNQQISALQISADPTLKPTESDSKRADGLHFSCLFLRRSLYAHLVCVNGVDHRGCDPRLTVGCGMQLEEPRRTPGVSWTCAPSPHCIMHRNHAAELMSMCI